jgi:CheY-like chemotaxis protein
MLLTQISDVGSVHVACDGDEGLQALTSGRHFALTLMDLQMPHLDGIECVRRVRAWEEAEERQHERSCTYRRARIIAVSANADDAATVCECLAVGFDSVLEKPLTLPTLRQLIQESLSSVSRPGCVLAANI